MAGKGIRRNDEIERKAVVSRLDDADVPGCRLPEHQKHIDELHFGYRNMFAVSPLVVRMPEDVDADAACFRRRLHLRDDFALDLLTRQKRSCCRMQTNLQFDHYDD